MAGRLPAAALLVVVLGYVVMPVWAGTTLRGEVTDAETGELVAARVYVRDEEGGWHFVRTSDPEGLAVPYAKRNWINTNAVEMHTTVSAHPFVADLPAGRYVVEVERGKEYFPARHEVTVGSEPMTLRVALRRWVNMEERGWYSGETHLHRSVEELRTVLLAEDLNVAFPLRYWVTRAFVAPGGDGSEAVIEGVAALEHLDERHVIWPRNTEYEIFTVDGRPHTLGAMFVLNHRSVLDRGVPPWGPVAMRAREEGALLDVDKLDWPFALVLPPVTGATLYELANNHLWRTEFAFTNWNSTAPPYLQPPYGGAGGGERAWLHYTLGTYYTLLNAGFPMVPTAGTANGVHPVPAGFSRVYVRGTGGLDYEGWLRGLAAGRSFVTTGPMLFVTVNGSDPGAVFRAEHGPVNYMVQGTVLSEQPLSFIEVIRNGRAVRTLMAENRKTEEGAFETRFSTQIEMEGSGWLAVRCFEDRAGGRLRFAHSAPWHVEVVGKPLRVRNEERLFLMDRMEAEIGRSRGVLPAAALDEYQRALERYRALEPEDDRATVGREGRTPDDEAELRYWLENMVWHHRFSTEEIRAATGLERDAIERAKGRLEIDERHRIAPSVGGVLRVLPYPGGRHPRAGFFDGAMDPQRETKISVFTPWEERSYVVLDVPEAIFSNRGLLYLAHRHVPTVWEQQGIALPRLEWIRHKDGSLELERRLPDGVHFGTRVLPGEREVRMEMWLHNGTSEPLTQLRVQTCVMLKAAAGFEAQTSQNKIFRPPYVAVRSDDGPRWIITAWEPLHRVWANPPVPCMHSDPVFPDCPAGETRRVRGWLRFFEGEDIESELNRMEESGMRGGPGE
jgi:hypothetical protein